MRVYAKHIVQRKSDSVNGSRQHHHPAPKGKPVSPPFSPRTARRPGQPDYLQGKGRRVGLLQNSGRRQMAEFRKKGGKKDWRVRSRSPVPWAESVPLTECGALISLSSHGPCTAVLTMLLVQMRTRAQKANCTCLTSHS